MPLYRFQIQSHLTTQAVHLDPEALTDAALIAATSWKSLARLDRCYRPALGASGANRFPK